MSTTRILAHHTSRGDEVPGTFADEAELTALAAVLRELGTGVFEVVPRGMDGEVGDAAHAELELLGRLAAVAGTRLTFSVVQTHTELDRWRLILDRSAELRDQGVPIYPQVANRATGILFGLQSRNNVFSTRPSYRALADLPLEERLARMRDPEVRARILAEPNGEWDHPLASFVYETFSNMLPVREPLDWEPTPADTMAAVAEREGRPAQEVVYDFLTEGDGRNLVSFPFTNYFNFSLDDVHDMLEHPASVWGLGDGGAHCGAAVDAGGPTLMLTHWVRDRTRGPRIDLATAVRWMTSDTADLYGLHDRGRIAPGHRADLNVIDHERLQIGQPEMVFDLPAGGRRLMQRATGLRGHRRRRRDHHPRRRGDRRAPGPPRARRAPAGGPRVAGRLRHTSSANGKGGQPKTTFLRRTNSSMPARPPSRPKPLCFTPPNGALGDMAGNPLTITVPTSSRRATRCARDASRVCR